MLNNSQILELREALRKAISESYIYSTVEDGGTSNFDTPILRLSKKWSKAEIKEAFLSTGLYPEIENDNTIYILRACQGQGFRRTAMAEAFRDSLRNSGFTSYVDYRTD